MCGIAGVMALADRAAPVDAVLLCRLRDAMAARGPDGAGLWLAEDGRVGLAHRRLAIIDPTADAAQPMTSADGAVCLSFNGEIYNHRALRAELEAAGCRFRTQSDTEVLLRLYQRHGSAMVERLRGMFAFALWDGRRRGLLLGRDPFGIKPLYHAQVGGRFAFASQVKALAAAGFATERDLAGQAGFLLFGYVPEPFSLYRSIRSLPAGSLLWVDAAHGPQPPQRYADPVDWLRQGAQAATARPLGDLLRDSVRHHLVSDVPVGVFLSAGIDSSVVLALAGEAAGSAPDALTLGFSEYRGQAQDEAPQAAVVAAAYDARHATRIIRRDDFDAALPALLHDMDQPSIDGVNTWFVARAARAAGWKVALSGLGGDELFGGYAGFRQIPRLAGTLAPLRPLRGLGAGLRRMAAPLLGRVTSPKWAGLLEYGTSVADAYLLRRALFMPWELPALIGADAARSGLAELAPRARLAETVRGLEASPYLQVMALELTWYLRNQLLRDADWAGMAHGVEIRTPLVDAWLFRALCPALATLGKADLAATARPPLPPAITDRPKTGFSVPVAAWTAAGQARRRHGGLHGWALTVAAAL